jgi:hypothetical protein
MAVSTKCPSTWDKFLDSLGLALDVVGLGTIGQSYSSSSTQTLTFTFNPCLRVLYFLGLFHNGWKREKSKLEQIWYWIANAPSFYNFFIIYFFFLFVWKIDTEEWGGRNCVLLFKNFLHIRKDEHTKEGGALILHFPYAKEYEAQHESVLFALRAISTRRKLWDFLSTSSSFLNAATTHEGTPNKKIRFETPHRIEKEEVVGDDNEEVLNDGEIGREWDEEE